MLQWINDRMKVIGWIFILPLGLVFALWGVQGIVSFTSQQDRGLKVNGEQTDFEPMRQAYQERMAQLARAFPEDVPADVKKKVQDGIVEEFVGTALFTQKVKEQRYTVTDKDVVASIAKVPAFQVGGQFNKDAYYAMLRTRSYSPERFEAEQRQLLKSQSLENGLYVSGFVTPIELARIAALRGEKRELSYAVLPVAKFLPTAKPDEAAIKAYYDGHAAEFKTPDTVKLSYIALRVADVAREVAVDEAGLKAYYETVKDRFVEAEKRHARHILIQSGSDDAAAQKKAQDLYNQAIKPGADFAALAKANSQDAGSAAQGGDLGTVERSFFVGPFANALFTMKAGEIKGPVKTQFGWHVIKLEEIQAGQAKTFDEARATIEPEYKRSEAERRFGERQEKLEQLAFENNGSLEPAAKALGLKVEEVPAFYEGLKDNELAANAKVVKAAFSADVIAGQNSRPVELTPGNVVVVRSADRRLPALQALEAVRPKAEEGARRLLAAKQAEEAGARLVASLNAGEKWDQALKALGPVPVAVAGKPLPADALKYEPAKFIGRTETTVPQAVVREAFKAKAPSEAKPFVASATLPGGDVAVYTVTAVKAGVAGADGAPDLRAMVGQAGEADIYAYIAAMRAHAEVRYKESMFE